MLSLARLARCARHSSTRPVSTSAIVRNSTISNQASEELLVSTGANKRLQDVLYREEYLRVKVNSGGCSGFQYDFSITKDIHVDDVIINKNVLCDETSLDLIRGSTIDYYEEAIRSTFSIVKNPQASDGCSCGASFSIDISL